MYYYIKGELVASTLNMAVVDAGGVGYRMTVSENTYRALPRRGDKNPVVTLYTYLSVREDGIDNCKVRFYINCGRVCRCTCRPRFYDQPTRYQCINIT